MVTSRVASSHESPINGPATMQRRAIAARVIEQEVTGNEAGSARPRGSGSAVACVVHRTDGISPKAGRHSENSPFRQPGEHVDPRGSDGRNPEADDGGVQ